MSGGWATLLPWLELRGVVSFGGLRFEHLSSLASRLCVDDRETLELLAKTFGPGVDPVVSWALEEGATPTFTAPDSDAIRHRVLLLAVAAIVANDYFQPFPPANSSHFEVVFHRFAPGAESFSIEYRRRDGKTLSSGHRYDEVRFHRPQATFGSQRVRWDQDLLY
jgi:hypothetical protein